MTVSKLIQALQKQNPQSNVCLCNLFDPDIDIKITTMEGNEILLSPNRVIKQDVDDDIYVMY